MLMNDGSMASSGRWQLADPPNVIGQSGFLRGRDAQGLMHAAEVIPRHENRDGRIAQARVLVERRTLQRIDEHRDRAKMAVLIGEVDVNLSIEGRRPKVPARQRIYL